MNSTSKPVNQMNRLADMGHFPVSVNAGATLNVLLTLTVTWLVQPHFLQPWAPVAFVAAVLACNLLPVVLLRLTTTPAAYPSLADMNFWADQHKFSDWVYVAASANMAFWVLCGWAISSLRHTAGTLILLLAVAFVATFSPVLLRSFRRPASPSADDNLILSA